MKAIMFILSFFIISLTSFSQIEGTTKDGRKVLLHDNGTYTWVGDEKQNGSDDKIDTELLFIAKHIDDMTDNVYYFPSKSLVCANPTQQIGFRASYSFAGKNDEKVKISGLDVMVVGLDCVEKTKLLFLFDDDSKLELTSWNEFNCKGNAWYYLSDTQLSQLSSNKIKKIRVQNGHNFESYTHELEGKDKLYFMVMFDKWKSKDIRPAQLED